MNSGVSFNNPSYLIVKVKNSLYRVVMNVSGKNKLQFWKEFSIMSWQNEDKVYLIMWKSRKTGATLSTLKKSEFGMENFVRTLKWMKVDSDTIIVKEQERPYKYVPKSERKGLSL